MAAVATGCARCGTILDPRFRFCPECALPATGETVLSTDIAEVRRRIEAQAAAPKRPPWSRYLFLSTATAVVAAAGVVGVLVFDPGLLNRVLPPAEVLRP